MWYQPSGAVPGPSPRAARSSPVISRSVASSSSPSSAMSARTPGMGKPTLPGSAEQLGVGEAHRACRLGRPVVDGGAGTGEALLISGSSSMVTWDVPVRAHSTLRRVGRPVAVEDTAPDGGDAVERARRPTLDGLEQLVGVGPPHEVRGMVRGPRHHREVPPGHVEEREHDHLARATRGLCAAAPAWVRSHVARCETMTPLGRPVLPLVRKIVKMSSSAGSGTGGSSGDAPARQLRRGRRPGQRPVAADRATGRSRPAASCSARSAWAGSTTRSRGCRYSRTAEASSSGYAGLSGANARRGAPARSRGRDRERDVRPPRQTVSPRATPRPSEGVGVR